MCLWVLPVWFQFLFCYLCAHLWCPFVTFYTIKCRATPRPRASVSFKATCAQTLVIVMILNAAVGRDAVPFNSAAVPLHFGAYTWVMTFQNNSVSICSHCCSCFFFCIFRERDGWDLFWSLVHNSVCTHCIVHAQLSLCWVLQFDRVLWHTFFYWIHHWRGTRRHVLNTCTVHLIFC